MFREFDPSGVAVEQGDAQLPFQRLHPLADGRRCEVQFGGRSGEAAEAGCSLERFQVDQRRQGNEHKHNRSSEPEQFV